MTFFVRGESILCTSAISRVIKSEKNEAKKQLQDQREEKKLPRTSAEKQFSYTEND